MHPVILEGGPGSGAMGSGAIGWLHAPMHPRGPGVVLCPALGREARWSYRAMRQLADRLADAGLPTLRLEYPGTGDSPDLPQGEEPFAAWQQSLHHAIDWMRDHSRTQDIALCGLRFGALLAAMVAADRSDIAALALLSPFLLGRSCVRDLRLAAFGGEGDDGPGDGIEVDGMVLSNATLAALTALDLRSMAVAPAPHILCMDESGQADRIIAQFEAAGARTIHLPFPGYAAMMRPATSNEIPQGALAAVADWFGELTGAALPQPRWPAQEPVLPRPASCERIVRFGPGRRLVGTLCEPAGQTRRGWAVLIPNTGGDARSGIARFGVRLAQRLAADGVASLRFDFAGLGDSTLPGDADSHLYLTDRSADIGGALAVLEDHGYERFGAAGLCTGAYHLLHAAAADARFERLALVNLVTFQWRPGDIIEVPQRALGHLPALAQAAPRASSPPSPWDDPRTPISTMLARGTRLLFLLGQGDPGTVALQTHFGPDGQALAAMPGATVRLEPRIDHTLSRRVMQDKVAGAVAGFLTAEMELALA